MRTVYFLSLLILSLVCRGINSASVDSESETKSPPDSLLSGYKTESRILMGGDATNPYPRALEAFKSPIMGFMCPKVHTIMNQVQEGLRYVFQTKNKWTLPIVGTGQLGAQAVLENLLEPEETVLIPTNGFWSERAADIAKRIGAEVKTVEKAIGSAFSVSDIEDAIKTHEPKVVYIVHGEASTGVIQEVVSELGEICRSNNCLLAVDFGATLGIVPVFAHKWKIDAACSNSHKGLGSVAGFAPVTFGPRAVEKIKKRKSPVPTFVLDMKNLTKFWKVDDGEEDEGEDNGERTFVHTLPVLQLYSLREALASLAEETLDKAWERHAAATKQFYEGAEKLELVHYVKKSKSRLIGTITFKLPDYVKDVKKLQAHVVEKYKIELGTGLGPTQGKILRVGIHGPNATPAQVEMLITALKEGLAFIKDGKGGEKGEAAKSPQFEEAAKAFGGFFKG